MSTRKPTDALVLGGTPRVHLLPGEIDDQRKAGAFRRSLFTVLAGAVLVVLLAIGGLSIAMVSATAEQATEQARSVSIAGQLKKLSSVTTIQSQITDIKTVQVTGTQGEILWEGFISSLQATLPGDTSITDFTAKLVAVAGAAPASPLEGKHIATLMVTAVGPQASVSQWLGHLPALKGVVNSTPGDVAVTPTPGVYRVNVTLLLNDTVVAHRFTPGT